MPHRFRIFKTRILCKFFFTYNGAFKPYNDILKLYSGVILQILFCKYQVWEPYSDVFKPYSDVFLQFMEIKSLKLDFHVDFFPQCTHLLTNRDLKIRVLS